MSDVCGICGRKLALEDDPLSVDCGGDCWGCIGLIEADLGNAESSVRVKEEFDTGVRPGRAKPGDL
jgi:hypothetical protein